MKTKYFIYSDNNEFIISEKRTKKLIKCGTLEISLDPYLNSGNIKIKFLPEGDLLRKFPFETYHYGEFHHVYMMGKEFNIQWRINGSQNSNIESEKIILNGNINTNSWGNGSCHITNLIERFLNQLLQLGSLENYLIFQKAIKNEAVNFRDKLQELADLINIYFSLIESNPCSKETHNVESLIKSRLKKIDKLI